MQAGRIVEINETDRLSTTPVIPTPATCWSASRFDPAKDGGKDDNPSE